MSKPETLALSDNPWVAEIKLKGGRDRTLLDVVEVQESDAFLIFLRSDGYIIYRTVFSKREVVMWEYPV